MRIGICGAGSFANHFIPLWQAHPLVSEVRLAEKLPERREAAIAKHGLTTTYESFEDLLASDVDAVGIFTQRWSHAPLAIKAMRAGKHVYSAVPAGITLEEMQELIDTVKETGQIYMLGETHYYAPETILCRKLHREGAFGRFVYGQSGYLHDMEHGFYPPYKNANGDGWEQFASFPPMLYPTHSVGQILGVTGSRMTKVSCLGQTDDHEDGIFKRELSYFDNAFSNETGLFRSADGGVCRANEFRRVTGRDSLAIYGTAAAFYEGTWHRHDRTSTDLSELLTCAPKKKPDDWEAQQREGAQDDFFADTSAIHDTERLPESFDGLPNGHHGSHQFLADDFANALHRGHTPVLNVWTAARFCAPGIVAHESAQRDGESMSVPDFGDPPADLTIMDLEKECGKAPPACCLPQAAAAV